MHAMLNIAIRAARAAGKVISRAYETPHHIEVEAKSRYDYVTNVDRAAEQSILEVILKAYPDHCIRTEETGIIEGKNTEHEWIIDPLDGTTNFMRGIPHFCVSIALAVKGVVQHAVIYDPLREEIFTASRGAGAQLNNFRIRVSNQRQFDQSLLATGFPFRNKADAQAYHATFIALFNQVEDVRRAGSAALDLAYVACGRLDGYWESQLHAWDLAAGSLLVREAGGIVTDFEGNQKYLDKGEIVAGSARVIKPILQQLRHDNS